MTRGVYAAWSMYSQEDAYLHQDAANIQKKPQCRDFLKELILSGIENGNDGLKDRIRINPFRLTGPFLTPKLFFFIDAFENFVAI